MSYRIWVSSDGQRLFTLWDTGAAQLAERGNSWETWGPPKSMVEERTTQAAPKQDGEASKAAKGTGSSA